MKVISTKNISFSGIKWGINRDEEKELPEDKASQDIILASKYIKKVKKSNLKTK